MVRTYCREQFRWETDRNVDTSAWNDYQIDVLLQIPYWDVPNFGVDIMHLALLGVTKRILQQATQPSAVAFFDRNLSNAAGGKRR